MPGVSQLLLKAGARGWGFGDIVSPCTRAAAAGAARRAVENEAKARDDVARLEAAAVAVGEHAANDEGGHGDAHQQQAGDAKANQVRQVLALDRGVGGSADDNGSAARWAEAEGGRS